MKKSIEQIIIDAYMNILHRKPEDEGKAHCLGWYNDPNDYPNTPEELETIFKLSDEYIEIVLQILRYFNPTFLSGTKPAALGT